ncbi:NAD(P)/FAD-dependent oxidoreductase [Herbaspirillum seropedicae]|uniref:NAD(P)/FAD-dependent oxidoreductase n=1 Tax=Herbaspirillum seropedicae TaxID=964 RepID=UPI002862A552|nr:FAD-dependent oxidoreductase [Herbaspirillum seropedicae]MDR6397519.1 3-phenylpropionate/trans-cinnamate dioxygenase ferredoxin reductase subunit [Herbaspirillum seropedicae]
MGQVQEHSGTVIVGACQAGVQLATTMRELGYAHPITLVGAEHELPYQRPPLSKGMLLGEIAAESLAFRSKEFFAAKGIRIILGEKVDSIRRAHQRGGVVITSAGRVVAFDKLALTVGARPRRLAVKGADARNVMYLRSMGDAVALREALMSASRIAIIGGGFIGLEVAASASKLGKSVTVALADQRIMARAVGPMMSAHFEQAHREQGVNILTSISIEEIETTADGLASAVLLGDGRRIEADLILVGIGAEPSIELAQQLGLKVGNGIVVDRYCVTSDGQTVAAGDCADVPNPTPENGLGTRARFESVNAAVEQARTAAASLVGAKSAYQLAPWFWTDQFDLKLQAVGVMTAHDAHVVRGDPEAGKFGVLYYRAGRLIAGEFVNSPSDFMATRAIIWAGKTVAMEEASDLARPLKSLGRPIEQQLNAGGIVHAS